MSARRVAIVTGTRAEFGLLTPVMCAVDAHEDLDLLVVAGGAHLLGDPPTLQEVEARFAVAQSVPMQLDARTGRLADARALGRGVTGFADAFDALGAHVVVVLGDRIEAFAAASAAGVMGVPVAHLHGGDVAEGVADEAMRHAITKLAHLHLPATESSATRIARMGEPVWRIHTVGSPAADVVRTTPVLDEARWNELGTPEIVVLQHPCGLQENEEAAYARAIAEATQGRRTLWLAPNHDPGREHVEAVRRGSGATLVDHLPSMHFTGMLKRLAMSGGVLVGNSSCALIEGALLGLRCVDIGPRQGGRERCGNVVHVDGADPGAVLSGITRTRSLQRDASEHPYGDGFTGERVADLLLRLDFSDPCWLRKRNAY
ncbi:MAG: UDP-N-acetylglucosamine 2-epimerase [Phycisphaerales bacterium]